MRREGKVLIAVAGIAAEPKAGRLWNKSYSAAAASRSRTEFVNPAKPYPDESGSRRVRGAMFERSEWSAKP